MNANIDPIYSAGGDQSADGGTTFPGTLLTATGDYTGASANHQLAFTANATSGGYIERLRFKALGTNIVTVARVYLNNGSANTTAGNNILIAEMTLPVSTAIANAATSNVDLQLGFAVKPGFRIYVGLGTTVAAGWKVTPIGGQYT